MKKVFFRHVKFPKLLPPTQHFSGSYQNRCSCKRKFTEEAKNRKKPRVRWGPLTGLRVKEAHGTSYSMSLKISWRINSITWQKCHDEGHYFLQWINTNKKFKHDGNIKTLSQMHSLSLYNGTDHKPMKPPRTRVKKKLKRNLVHWLFLENHNQNSTQPREKIHQTNNSTNIPILQTCNLGVYTEVWIKDYLQEHG